MDGTEVPGYTEEEGVAADSRTETFAALRVSLDTWRWSRVPFLLRTGKRLSRRTDGNLDPFQAAAILLFADRLPSATPPNVLTFRIQPQEGITIGFNSKIPGPTTQMRPVNMDFSYGSAFGEELPEAYERLLLDAMLGDSTLYMRKDEVDSAWSFITDILRGWENHRCAQPRLVSRRQRRPGGCRFASRLVRETLEEVMTTTLDPRGIEQEIALIRERESNPFSAGVKANLFTLLVVRSAGSDPSKPG